MWLADHQSHPSPPALVIFLGLIWLLQRLQNKLAFKYKHMRHKIYAYFLLLPLLIWPLLSTSACALESALELRDIYTKTVDSQLKLPAEEQRYYAELLLYKLQQGGLTNLPAQYLLMIDRNSRVQAALLLWLSEEGAIELIGASPASTGKKNGYDYFETPLGIFEHHIDNPDFRAEGTKNKLGLMGYGPKGLRVYDFGWVVARKTWLPEMGKIRLQLHATDPLIEPRLGSAQSKGCIRIPATLNKLLDHYGLLDADYERNISNKSVLNLLDTEREPTPWSGRYMIVVDSRRAQRPDWSPVPILHQRTEKKLKHKFPQ